MNDAADDAEAAAPAAVAPAAVVPAAAAPARQQDNTSWLKKSPEFRWMVAQYAHKLKPMSECGDEPFRLLVVGSFKNLGSNAKKAGGKATAKWKEIIDCPSRRLEAIEYCVQDIINNHPFVAEQNLTRNDITLDAGVDPSDIKDWNEAAPPAAGGEGGALPAGAGTAGSGAAAGVAGAGQPPHQSPAPGLRQLAPNSASNAGGGTGSGSKRGRIGAGGGASAAASMGASARSGGGGASGTASAATGSPSHKKQRPGSAGAAAAGKENRGAGGTIVSAPSVAAAAAAASTSAAMRGADSSTALGSAGSTFILKLSEEDKERINAFLDVMATDEGQAMVQQQGRELNGGAMSVPVSAVDSDPDKNKAYRELESLLDHGSSHKLIPPEQFEDIILQGVLKERPDLTEQAINGGFEWAVSSLDLLFGQGDKRGPQPTHGDCKSRPFQYFASTNLTKDGAEGTEVLDQTKVVICNTAAKLRQHATGWKEMPDSLVESLDNAPATMELLRDFGQVVSGGQRVCPGMVPQFFTTLLGGSHPHNGPPSETKNRVVLFFTLYRKGMTDPYDGDSQHSREMICMKLYETLRGDLSIPDAKFLLERYLHYFVDSAKRGARDNALEFPDVWNEKITELFIAVEKWSEAGRQVDHCEAELAKVKGEIMKGTEEHVILVKETLARSCTSSEMEDLRARLGQILDASIPNIDAKEAELKNAIKTKRQAELDMDKKRGDLLFFMQSYDENDDSDS